MFILGLSGGKSPPQKIISDPPPKKKKIKMNISQNWIPKHFRRDFLTSFWGFAPRLPPGLYPGPDLPLLFKLHDIWLVDSQENH